MHGYRDFIQITINEFKSCIKNIGKDKLEREKLGNRYGSKLKVYLIEDGKRKDMVFYLYGEIDRSTMKRKFKSIEYYINPKYYHLLKDEITIVAIDQSIFVKERV